jgi:hypothetical protein
MARRFDNRQAQIAGTVFGSVVLLIGLAGIAQPETGDKVRGLVWMTLGIAIIWRAAVTSNVVLRTNRVELRSIVRTRRVSLQQLDSVSVEVGRTGMNGFAREYLVLHLHDGATAAFKELNSKPSDTAETVVQRAAREINAALGT